jgi:hypothetical protein
MSGPVVWQGGSGLPGQGEAVGENDGEGCEWRRSCRSDGPWKMAAITSSTNNTTMTISVKRRTTAG